MKIYKLIVNQKLIKIIKIFLFIIILKIKGLKVKTIMIFKLKNKYKI